MADDLSEFSRLDGFIPILWSEREARLLLELQADRMRVLHLTRISGGLGEFPLERGQLSRPTLVRFERRGPKVAMIAENVFWRTSSGDPAAQQAIVESFPESVLAVFGIVSERDGRLVVDATSFFMQDAAAYSAALERAGYANYRHEPGRSLIVSERSRAFETSTQVEARLTFVNPAAPVASIWNGYGQREGMVALAPDPRSVTLGIRHAFLQLPEDGFVRRYADPRAGYCCSVIYDDFAAPLGEDQTKRLMIRHRLEKLDPDAPMSRPRKPLVYYVDRGFPEPMRSAILEGARWWNEAFEAAGFIDALRVELMPEDADPMDFRYNTITFAARAVHAFAWGGTVVDPRTGEIIKGEVTLTAQKDRQLQIAIEALASSRESDRKSAASEVVVGYLRLLAAHEVGHTLGLGHNFAVGPETSIMDYATPFVEVGSEGCIDLGRAYRKGIGSWDKVSISYGYRQLPAGLSEAQERAFLDGIIADSIRAGLFVLGNDDSAVVESAHPDANYWTHGSDPVSELERMVEVRRTALADFGPHVLTDGEPMGRLEDYLAPVYRLHTRYVTAASKTIGGLDYRHALKGDGQRIAELLDGPRQRRALAAILRTVEAGFLTLPEELLRQLPPRPPAHPRTVDSLPNGTGSTFDPLAAAASVAQVTLDALLEPRRLNRVVEHQHRDRALLRLDEVIEGLISATWRVPTGEDLAGAVGLTVAQLVLEKLLATARSPLASPLVRAGIQAALTGLKAEARLEAESMEAAGLPHAHRAAAVAAIEAFERQPAPPPFAGFQPRGPLPGP